MPLVRWKWQPNVNLNRVQYTLRQKQWPIFFQTQKLTWYPLPICTIFGGCIKCMQVFIFFAHAKVMAAFRHKNQHDALIQFAYILVDLYGICSWSIPVNRMEIKPMIFMQQMLARTDISEKLKMKFTLVWCLCINSLHSVFTHHCLKKETRTINYKPKISQNAALLLNGMHLNSPSTECWTPCRAARSSGTAWVGNAYARSLAPWPILSISDYDDTTSPHQTF